MIDGNPVVFLLSQFGDIKNCRISPSFDEVSESIICYPPSVIWWYKNPDINLQILIEETSKFPGKFTWTIKKERNCWRLHPSFLEELSQQESDNIEQSSIHIMTNEPDLGIKANLEFRKLIEFLIQEIAGKSSAKI